MTGRIFVVFIFVLYSVPLISGTTLPEGTRVTGCYGSDTTMSVSCSPAKVAISGFYYGFKPLTPNCNDENTCCTYDENTDCLEADTSTSTVMGDLSGQSSGLVSTSNKVGETCSGLSTYNVLVYQCVQGTSIKEMCTTVSSTSEPGYPLYLWNRAYTTVGILPTDTLCNCSVETSSHTSDITMYIIHMDLYDDPTDCQQSIMVSDSSGTALRTFQCETPLYNTIQNVTVSVPYISVRLENFYTAASGGKFWIGFEATDASSTVTINCPEQSIPDCGTPDDGIHSTFTITGTDYGSTATYNCSDGYVQQSGDTERVCLQDGKWNGTAFNCVYDCGALPNPGNGSVSHTTTVTGSEATYSCNSGYTLSWTVTRTCIVGDGWNSIAPQCFKDCYNLADIEVPPSSPPSHSSVSLSGTSYGSTATYTCDNANYTRQSGHFVRHCKQDGQWNGTELICIYECGSPGSQDNGYFIENSTVTDGVAQYYCNTSYTLSGDSARTCFDGSGWNGSVPVCIYDCGQPDAPDNGNVSVDKSTTGGLANYACDANYTLIGDATRTCANGTGWVGLLPECYKVSPKDKVRTCDENGNWSGSEATCELLECRSLNPGPNVNVTLSDGNINGSEATFTCSRGYDISDQTSLVCINETWIGSMPSCTIKECRSLNPGPNVNVTLSDGNINGSEATFTCSRGYDISDQTSLVCINETWIGYMPSCTIKDCGQPGNIVNGNVDVFSTSFGSNVTYTCDLNYGISNGDTVRTCDENGNWSGSEGTCELLECRSLNPGPNVKVTLSNGNINGSEATFTCSRGYDISDQTSLVCINETWIGSMPSCTIKACEHPGNIANGSVLVDSITFGSIVTYICDINHNISNGDIVRRCLENGNWSGSKPTCKLLDCPSAENTTGVMVTVNGTSYQSVATYKCTHGYEHAHGDVTRTCQADGTWSGSERVCLFDCGPLPPPEYGKVTSSGSLAGSTVIITCDEGFTLMGSSRRTCVEKWWNGTEAVCLRDCPVPEKTTTVTVTTEGLDYGSKSTYTCVSGYVHDSGDQTVTCQADGTWSGTALKCTEDATFDQPLITILALACSGTLAVILMCVLVAFIRARRAFISNNIRDNEITVHPPGPAAESDIQIQMVENPENVYHTIDDNANEYETLPPGRTTHENVYHTIDDYANEYETLPPGRTTQENVYTSLN